MSNVVLTGSALSRLRELDSNSVQCIVTSWYNVCMPIRKLPPNDMIVGLYRSGLSTGEIAERFGVKPVTVHSLLVRIGEPRRSAAEAAKIRDAKGRAVHESYWKGKKQPAEMVERRVSKIRGEAHYLWKGGKERRPYCKLVTKESCQLCSCKENLGVHHVDFDHYNDAPENLQVLCVSCHMSVHKTAYWEAKRAGTPIPKSNGRVGWTKP